MRKKIKKSYKGKVIKASKEFVEFDGKDNSVFDTAPRTADKGSGIYALYDDHGLYYIGLSGTSIRGRLKVHAHKDKHAGKWKRFSWYHIPNYKYVKDIETALLRIVNPRGNKVMGKVKKRKKKTKSKNS